MIESTIQALLISAVCLFLASFLAFLIMRKVKTTEDRLKLLWSSEHARGTLHLPKYAGDAGYDLSISEPMMLAPGALTKVPCGIRVALPEGVSSLVIPRSWSASSAVLVFSTLIDSGYRGPLFVFCFNLGSEPISLEAGMRLAQLLPIYNIPMETEQVPTGELPASERGSNGFGSSGGAANGTTS